MPTERIREVVGSDREALKGFTCTVPATWSYHVARGRSHPSAWELEAQSQLRDLRPPFRDGSSLLVLEVDGAFAGVCWVRPMTDTDAALIACIGVEVDMRGRGLGGRFLEDVPSRIDAAQPGVDVLARINRRNERSRRMFRSSGFEFLEVDEFAPEVDVWMRCGIEVD